MTALRLGVPAVIGCFVSCLPPPIGRLQQVGRGSSGHPPPAPVAELVNVKSLSPAFI